MLGGPWLGNGLHKLVHEILGECKFWVARVISKDVCVAPVDINAVPQLQNVAVQ